LADRTRDPEELLITRKFRVLRHHVTGRDGRDHPREIVHHPGAVTILPLLDDGRVCLIRNQRVAVGGELVELPAGTLEPSEDPRATAIRELAEETGYRAQAVEKLCEFFMSPGILNERMHLFLATGLQAGATALEAGEEIETLLVTWSEAMNMVASGTIQDAKTLVGLLFYQQFRNQTTTSRN
jgi:ADP-ribose pyrophosphatase